MTKIASNKMIGFLLVEKTKNVKIKIINNKKFNLRFRISSEKRIPRIMGATIMLLKFTYRPGIMIRRKEGIFSTGTCVIMPSKGARIPERMMTLKKNNLEKFC